MKLSKTDSGTKILTSTAHSTSKSNTSSSNFQVSIIESTLSVLLKEVEREGNIFKKNPTIRGLKRYQEKVKEFMNSVVKNMYEKKDFKGQKDKRSMKVYTLIDEVNKRLKSMAENFLTAHEDVITILAKLDEIKGLLIDLYT